MPIFVPFLLLGCDEFGAKPNDTSTPDSGGDSPADTGERPLTAPLGAIAVGEDASDVVPMRTWGEGEAEPTTVVGFLLTPTGADSLCFSYPLDVAAGQDVLEGLGRLGAVVPTAPGPGGGVLLAGTDFGVNVARAADLSECAFGEGFQFSPGVFPQRPSIFYADDATGDGQPDWLIEACGAPGYPKKYSDIYLGSAFVFEGPVPGAEGPGPPYTSAHAEGRWGSSPELVFDGPAAGLRDVNGDGLADFIAGGMSWDRTGTSSPVVPIVPFPLDGAFFIADAATAIETGESGAEPRELLAFGDFNGDGQNDVVLGGVDGAVDRTAFLMLGPIVGFVSVDDAAATFPLGDGTLAFAGDVDHDGSLDLALGEPEASRGDGPRGRISVLLGPFAGEVVPDGTSPTWWGKRETDHCGGRISWIGDANGAPGDELAVYCHDPGPPEQWFIEIVSAG